MMNMVNDEFISLNSKSFSELLADDENAEKSRDRDERSQAQDQGPSANMDANNSACNGTNGANNSTARFRSMTPSSIPIPKSPGLFTVPPGFSPSSFLDSPVLLPSSQAMISPTTGTFPLLPLSFENTSNNDEFKNMEMGDSSGFAFKPHAGSGFGLDFHSMGNLGTYGYEHHQYFKGHENETSMFPTTGALTEQHVSVPSLQAVSSEGIAAPEDSFDDQQQEQSSESNLNSDPVTTVPCGALEKPCDDGYNWRKYGQKHVKGSECPRSYYKCTHPGCPTKKKVERSPDGQVTEIIYKGVHNHAKPQATRRVGCFSNPANEDGDLVEGCTSVKVEDQSNPQGQNSSGTPEHSSISESEEFDGRAVSNNAGDDEDEPDSKRIKCETNARDIIGATRTIREPRVVVQTTSDIDILDDGYRWRKYGQKVVKGNPNPRSYYKCTNSGCQVRKHVERAAHDPKAVITTYEGKHNHDVPAPRSSSHGSAPAGLGTASSLTSLPNNNALPVPSGAVNLSASDIQGTVSQFDNQHELGNQYERNMGVQLGYGVFGLQNKNEEMHKATTMPVSHATQMKHSDHAISSAGLNSSSMHQYFFQQNESRNGLIQPKEELTDNFQFNTSLH